MLVIGGTMTFKTYTIPDLCITYYVERNGPIAGNSPVKKLEVPHDQSLIFYTLRIGRIAMGWEVKGKRESQKIKWGAEIIPLLKNEEDFHFFTDDRLQNEINKARRKIERELREWANKKSPDGTIPRMGSHTYLSQSRKYEVKVNWKVLG